MSQNDHTGLESYTNDELISEVNRASYSNLGVELAKRLEDESGASEQLQAIDDKCGDLNISIAGMLQMADAMIDSPATTVALLQTLAKYDVDSVDELTKILITHKENQ